MNFSKSLRAKFANELGLFFCCGRIHLKAVAPCGQSTHCLNYWAVFLPRSSYYLRKTIRRRKDKYCELKKRITEIFTESRNTYGYRRVKAELEKSEIFVSEKVIRQIMKKMNLTVQQSRRAKYNSYKGEISPAVENLIKRDFKLSLGGLSPMEYRRS